MSDLAPPAADVRVSGNLSAPLDDPDQAWIVTVGQVLAVRRGLATRTPTPRRPHRGHATSYSRAERAISCSEWMRGMSGVRWFVVGLADAAIRSVDLGALVADARRPQSVMRDRLERWLDATESEHPPVADLLDAMVTRGDLAGAVPARRGREIDDGRRRRMLEAARIEAAEAQVASATENAVDALASVFDWRRFLTSRLVDQQDELVDACRVVGDRLGIRIQPPATEDLARTDSLAAIARASKVRFRRVGLSADWWRREGELGELVDGGHVALLPRRRRRGYELMDPASGRSTIVSETERSSLRPVAVAAGPAPPGRGISFRSLFAFSLRGARRDAVRTLVFATFLGVLALVPPLATQLVFGQIVPEVPGRLLALVAELVGVAVAASLFEIARGIALLRARVRLGNALQMALWDRMLRLPAASSAVARWAISPSAAWWSTPSTTRSPTSWCSP